MNVKRWIVYLLRCSDDSLYCGITNDLNNRLAAHNLGKGAKFTRSRTPVELVGVSFKMTHSEALKLEYRIKQASRSDKITLLKNMEDKLPSTATDLKKDLKALLKEFKDLGKKLDKLIKAVDKAAKTKPAPVKKAPSKSKTTKTAKTTSRTSKPKTAAKKSTGSKKKI